MKLPSETLRRGLCVSVALLGLSMAPAFAQEVSQSHLSAAREAVDALDVTEQFDQILLNAATQIKAELIVNNPNLQSEISTLVDDEALKLAPRRGDLESEIARIYAKLFTEQELREIGQFYQTEAGKKLLAQGPTASRDMMSAADVWASGIVRDLRGAAINGTAKLAPAPEAATATTTQ